MYKIDEEYKEEEFALPFEEMLNPEIGLAPEINVKI